MTRAAEKVFLSPGTVSLQLHKLADELHTVVGAERETADSYASIPCVWQSTPKCPLR
jgi:hypothetical protein